MIASSVGRRIAVLVAVLDTAAYPGLTLARHYRERPDAENIYDELKKPMGWSGHTTQKLAPSRLMANLISLIYNWWHLYHVRFCDGDHHREAFGPRS